MRICGLEGKFFGISCGFSDGVVVIHLRGDCCKLGQDCEVVQGLTRDDFVARWEETETAAVAAKARYLSFQQQFGELQPHEQLREDR